MDPETSDIHDDIAATRQQLERKLDEIGERLRESVDVRHRVAARPWTALGVAAVAGFLLGRRRIPERAGPAPERRASLARDDRSARRGAGATTGGDAVLQIGLAILTAVAHEFVRRGVPAVAASVEDRLARKREDRRSLRSGERSTPAHPASGVQDPSVPGDAAEAGPNPGDAPGVRVFERLPSSSGGAL